MKPCCAVDKIAKAMNRLRSTISAWKRRSGDHPKLTVILDAASNYGTVIWMGVLSLLSIPIYIRHLGPGEWGVVAACMTLQGALAFLDAGLGQIMPRSLARVAGLRDQEYFTFESFSRLYMIIGLAGFIAGQVAISWTVEHWFISSQSSPLHLELALRLVLIQFLFAFANNANVGYWNGMQLQRKGNLRAGTFAMLRHGTAIVIVLWGWPTAFGYLVPFVIVTIAEWISNRRAIKRIYELSATPASVVQRGDLLALLRDGWSFYVAVLVGLVLTQTDRLFLSSTQELTQYGYYVVVANLGVAFSGLQTPLLRAYFPTIAREARARGSSKAGSLGKLLLGVLILCVMPTTLAIVLAPELLMAWLKSPSIVQAATRPMRFILAGVAVNAVYNVIYQVLLAEGAGGIVVAINALAIATVLVVANWSRVDGGIATGGYMCLAAAICQLLFGSIWLLGLRRRTSMVTGQPQKEEAPLL
jgi:O-antigen/teichoic acid export membrane protein